MHSLEALQLFYDGPAPEVERAHVRLGSTASLQRTTQAARERFLDLMAQRAARALAVHRGRLASATLQDELKRFRLMALTCRERRSPAL